MLIHSKKEMINKSNKVARYNANIQKATAIHGSSAEPLEPKV